MNWPSNLLYALPAFLVVAAIVFFMAWRYFRLSLKVQDYQMDRFRHSIEMQIAKLSDQLAMTEDRFRQINHLILDSQSQIRDVSDYRKGSSDILDGLGVKLNVNVDDELVFVLMPFNPQYDDRYQAIKSTIQDLGFRCSRGDERIGSRFILSQILQEMLKSRIVIADISGRNPNVFYELGFAHALRKPVLIISQGAEDIPFDVSALRVLIYTSLEDLRNNLRKWFVHTLALPASSNKRIKADRE
jgi:hypothetical protein